MGKENILKEKKPKDFVAYMLYRIYYENEIVYVGRTTQPLQKRLHGHLFKARLQREIDINKVTKSEFSTYPTRADMYLYEIYFINVYKPVLNVDDLARDKLTVTLPAVEWQEWEGVSSVLWDKWKKEILKKDDEENINALKKKKAIEKHRQLRKEKRDGKITEDEYWDFYDKEVAPYISK